MRALAFCVFSGRLYISDSILNRVFDIGANKLEAIVFDALSEFQGPFDTIIIPAGPAPFTQLRILRSIQLGLAAGYGCEAKLISMYDVLFTAAHIQTGACFLQTRRGDYFFQKRENGAILEEGVTASIDQDNTGAPIISDIPGFGSITLTPNIAQVMLTHSFPTYPQLIYGIDVSFRTS